jgi:putative phosphoesterase
MITIGVLSDTHLTGPNKLFREKVNRCFADVDMILHAGDLTHISVLDAFDGKTIHAVHGNMCGYQAQIDLPAKKVIEVNGFQIGLAHGAGFYRNIEERLYNEFGPLDCIVYGHTHKAAVRRIGKTLFVNPGSFSATGRYGASGTYAIITVDDKLAATIHTVEPTA